MLRHQARQLPNDPHQPAIIDCGDVTSVNRNNDIASTSHSQQMDIRRSKSLFVYSLPKTATAESLTTFFSQTFPIKHATVVLNPLSGLSMGYGFVTFTDFDDAQRAQETLQGSMFEDRKIKIKIADPRHRKKTTKMTIERNPRTGLGSESIPVPSAIHESLKLIVRNLPWSIKAPNQLSALFRRYGKVKYATMPMKKPGVSAGFGFIQLRGKKNAENAIIGMNGKVVDGRVLAVDWAVEKSVWMKHQRNDDCQNMHTQASDVGMIIKSSMSVKLEGHENTSSQQNETTANALEVNCAGKGAGTEIDNSSQTTDRLTNNSTLFIRNIPFNVNDDALLEAFAPFGSIRYARVVVESSSKRSQGVGFVCFCRQEDADACLRDAPQPSSKKRQEDPTSRGFVSPPSKQSLLQNLDLDSSGRYTLYGRVLHVSQAICKSEAKSIMAARNSIRDTRDDDKKRLYLLAEGTISSTSCLHNQISTSESYRREESFKQRNSLIKSNPTLHISLTRLSVRNLPRTVSSKFLKALAREAVVGFAKDVKAGIRKQLSKEELTRGGHDLRQLERDRKAKGKGIVKQAKVIFESREGKKVGEDYSAGRSKGYGFIEYSSHRWALMGLRWLNGQVIQNPSMAGDDLRAGGTQQQEKKKRLIVEFAIEKSDVVERRREKEAQSQERYEPSGNVGKSDISAFSTESSQVTENQIIGRNNRKDVFRQEGPLQRCQSNGAMRKDARLAQRHLSQIELTQRRINSKRRLHRKLRSTM